MPGKATVSARRRRDLLRGSRVDDSLSIPASGRRSLLQVPFNKASLAGNELLYLKQALRSLHISGAGTFTDRCHKLLQEEIGAKKVLLTTSCTDALEMCALLLHIRSGHEVVVPSFAFVTTANAFTLHGAKPIFVDIRSDTLNIDESQIEEAITARTRAIVILNYAGVGCEMEAIRRIAARHGLPIVEDNAHGLFGTYKGHALGSFGNLATQSFHETKNITCGEGGALIINDSRFIARGEVIWQKGTDRSRYLRGEVDKYTWVDLGSSYLISDLLAAFLLAQLEARKKIQANRRRLWARYDQCLESWSIQHGVRRPIVPEHCQPPWHIYHLVMPTSQMRTAFIAHLRKQGIHATFHFLPLHLSPMGRRFGPRPGQCAISTSISERLVRLPLYAGMTRSAQDAVLNSVLQFNRQ